jgi:ornithine cyclodeaminase/alanine dehydrogenase-like protein (mu-crystallin family)
MTGFRTFGPAEIRDAVTLAELIEPVARALAEFSQDRGESPLMVLAPGGQDGDVHVKAAWLPGVPVFTVKVAASFAARASADRSANSGFIAVLDAATGDLRALLLDDHHLTDLRTAAAGAVAARLLARADARTVAVLGTGTQAYLQVLAVCAVRPVDTVLIWGRNQQAARGLAERLPELSAVVMTEPEAAVRRADIVVTATSSRQPVLRGQWLAPGQHVTAIGADDPGKAELDPDCFARADLLAVDSRKDTPRIAGDLRAAIEAGVIQPGNIDAELGELVLGSQPGRQDDHQLTVAKLIGLGVQDLAAAEVAIRQLERRKQATNPRQAVIRLHVFQREGSGQLGFYIILRYQNNIRLLVIPLFPSTSGLAHACLLSVW